MYSATFRGYSVLTPSLARVHHLDFTTDFGGLKQFKRPTLEKTLLVPIHGTVYSVCPTMRQIWMNMYHNTENNEHVIPFKFNPRANGYVYKPQPTVAIPKNFSFNPLAEPYVPRSKVEKSASGEVTTGNENGTLEDTMAAMDINAESMKKCQGANHG